MSTAILATRESATASRAMRYELVSVWPTPGKDLREEVVDFWLSEGALPDRPGAEERAHQLLVVARDEHGQVAGVSTAVPALIPQLGFECFYYRMFVGRAHRTQGLRSTQLYWRILRQSYEVLNGRFLQGHDPHVLGCYAEIESRSILKTHRNLVLQSGGMNAVYIGHTPDGRHIRVWYFEGAQIP